LSGFAGGKDSYESGNGIFEKSMVFTMFLKHRDKKRKDK